MARSCICMADLTPDTGYRNGTWCILQPLIRYRIVDMDYCTEHPAFIRTAEVGLHINELAGAGGINRDQ